MTTPVTRIAIVGAGVIGASWATAFLARGMDVVASDPAPGAEEALRKTVDAQWPAMVQIGLSPAASMERLRFVASPEDAVADAGFVQENGPERLDIKRNLFRRLDEAAPPDGFDVVLDLGHRGESRGARRAGPAAESELRDASHAKLCLS